MRAAQESRNSLSSCYVPGIATVLGTQQWANDNSLVSWSSCSSKGRWTANKVKEDKKDTAVVPKKNTGREGDAAWRRCHFRRGGLERPPQEGSLLVKLGNGDGRDCHGYCWRARLKAEGSASTKAQRGASLAGEPARRPVWRVGEPEREGEEAGRKVTGGVAAGPREPVRAQGHWL